MDFVYLQNVDNKYYLAMICPISCMTMSIRLGVNVNESNKIVMKTIKRAKNGRKYVTKIAKGGNNLRIDQ